MNILIGNAITLIASIIMVVSGYCTSRSKTLILQTIQIGLDGVACIFLGSYGAAFINALSIPRNVLTYKNKMTLSVKILIGILTVLSLFFNTIGWIGYLPILSAIIYLYFVDTTDGIQFKLLVIVTLMLWTIHDYYIQNYVAVTFNVGCIITSSIAIYRLQKGKENETINYCAKRP